MEESSGFLDGPNGRIAYRTAMGGGPTIVWLGGFQSDMTGAKAQALSEWARAAGRAFLRFDYSGHGASDGRFEEGTISAWLADSLAAIDRLVDGPLILVGSSMGGWIAALAALERPQRVAGVVLIAPAVDFTEELIWRQLSASERERLVRNGRIERDSRYAAQPTIYTRALIEDGRRRLLLGGVIALRGPVRIIQGMNDEDVPWRHALRVLARLSTDDAELLLIKSGDHRLSKPDEIERIIAAVQSVQ
jgi:pimeloyl-ACP methyl ester carboxylesterase